MIRLIRSLLFVAVVPFSLLATSAFVAGCGGPSTPAVPVPSPSQSRPDAASASVAQAAGGERADHERIVLRDGWGHIQSSAVVAAAATSHPPAPHPPANAPATGKDISTPGYAAAGWYPITVPSTVFAGLVANHVYPDPYVGNNLTIAPRSAFDVSWWYRTEVVLPASAASSSAWLDLDGVNFKANVWLNGQLVASSAQVEGTFTAYDLDVTALAPAVRRTERDPRSRSFPRPEEGPRD